MAPIKPKSNTMRVVKPKEAPQDEVRSGTGFHIGETLRDARQQRGLDLEMVSDELMIRRFYLEALEQGSFKDLPERVYATGFVRNYATYLGLDGGQCVEQFKREAYGNRGGAYQVELSMPTPITHSMVPGRSAIISACVALVIIIAGIIFATRNLDNNVAVPSIPEPAAALDSTVPPLVEDVPATTAETASPEAEPAIPLPQTDEALAAATTEEAPLFEAPTPEPTSVAPKADVAPALPETTAAAALPEVAAKTDTAAVAAAATVQGRIVIEALQSSWVEVKDGKGIILFTNILKAGQLLPIPDQKGVTLTTGNAGGLRVIVDGKPQKPLGQVNEVKRSLPLNADNFSAN